MCLFGEQKPFSSPVPFWNYVSILAQEYEHEHEHKQSITQYFERQLLYFMPAFSDHTPSTFFLLSLFILAGLKVLKHSLVVGVNSVRDVKLELLS